jgi:hypothetical protein
MSDDTDERGEEYVARQRGGDHLPECIVKFTATMHGGQPDPQTLDIGGPCICWRLRACEARVRDEYRWLINKSAKAVDETLDAARDAVAALTDPVPDVERTMWTTAEVLAAIDALRGESNG